MRALIALLVLAGCAHPLPGGYRRDRIVGVEDVETFWWYRARQCDLRIVYRGGPTDYAGRWIRDVDPAWCGESKRRSEP